MISYLLELTEYEIRTIIRQSFSWVTPLLFFIIVVSLFPLALGSDPNLLKTIAPGIIWVAALLAVLISIGNIFKIDSENGFMDSLLLSPLFISYLAMSKILAHWMTHCVPLILLTPFLGLSLHLDIHASFILTMTLLIGTPILCLIGSIGAALLTGVNGSGLLLPILIMPFYIPILIFGTGTVVAASLQQPLSAYFAILGALLVFSLAFAPVMTGISLKMGGTQS